MTRAPCDIANIGLAGRRRRMTFGIVALAIGFVAAVALVYAGIARPWRLVLALPILAGVSGVLQAREHTWVGLASRGLRDMDDGMHAIDDPAELLQVRSQARRVNLRTLLIGGALLALAVAAPPWMSTWPTPASPEDAAFEETLTRAERSRAVPQGRFSASP